MYKMVPRGRYGGIMQTPYQREPLILSKQVPKGQAGMMMPLPINNNQNPAPSSSMERLKLPSMQALDRNYTTTPIDTNVLAPMTPKSVPSISPGVTGAGVAAGIGTFGAMGAGLIDGFSKDPGQDAFGIQKTESAGAGIGKGALKGAAAGATLGPWGAAVGGVIGAATGFFGNKKANKEFDIAHNKAQASATRNEDASMYRSMMAKNGIKFDRKIDKITSDKKGLTPIFKLGGTMGSKNVIAKGKLHKENNNLGDKDKGIPVIDDKGVKKYELEKEEWVITNSVTKQINTMASKYKTSNSDSDLESLGKFVSKELLSNTQDNSGRYGMGEKS